MELTALDKMKRARVCLQRTNPFFAYLSLYLKFQEDDIKHPRLDEFAGMGVNAFGDLIYSKKFVDKLSEQELIGVLIHEILHLSFLHLTRRKRREPLLWNISADVVCNQVIKENGFQLPQGCIISDYNNNIKVFGVEIKDVNKKTAEMIFEELWKNVPKNKGGQGQNKKGKGKKEEGEGEGEGKEGEGEGRGFDKHIYCDKDGNELDEKQVREQENYWKGKSEEALTTAKLRGKLPNGIERMIGDLHKEKVEWRTLLQKYIQRAIPMDYSFASCSKKSVACGYFMPNTIKDRIDIAVAIDTSGSIGKEELTDFISEIVGISKAFMSRVKIRLLTHDCVLHDDMICQNGNISKIQGLEIHGGGGTSHLPIFKHIQDNIRDCKLLVCFTDGFSDLDSKNVVQEMDKTCCDKLFVISSGGDDKQLKGKRANVIKLGDYKFG